MKKFFYRVQKGDSAVSIAKTFSLPVCHLINLNNLTEEVLEGDLLYMEIPDCTVYKVLPLDTVSSVAKKFNISADEILEKNNIPYIFYGIDIFI